MRASDKTIQSDEVTVQDMKRALDNPNLDIKRARPMRWRLRLSHGASQRITAKYAKYANRDLTNAYFLRTESLSRSSRLLLLLIPPASARE